MSIELKTSLAKNLQFITNISTNINRIIILKSSVKLQLIILWISNSDSNSDSFYRLHLVIQHSGGGRATS